MTPIQEVIADLEASGFTDMTPERAERIAVQAKGSVEAYVDFIRQCKSELENVIEPAPGPVSSKWSDPLAYDIVPADEAE